MKLRKLLTAAALVSATFLTGPAAAEDITLEFVVWNYSLDTGLSRQSRLAFSWRHAHRRDLRRSGLVAGLGGGRIRGAD